MDSESQATTNCEDNDDEHMGLYERERQLSILSGASACLSIVTIIGIAVPWTHWKEILDTCLSMGCGCILYGTQSFYTFNGGRDVSCYFTTIAPIPVLIVAIILATYHGYRVCMFDKKPRRRRNGDVAVIHPERKRKIRDPGFVCWVVFAVLASLTSILVISIAVTLTDGMYTTCREYRQNLSKNGQITGQMAAAINGRLSCNAIFDFMDYLEPVTRPFIRKEYINYNHPHDEKDFQRGPFINTGVSLQAAIASAWLNTVVWIIMIINYAVLTYASADGCFCCSK